MCQRGKKKTEPYINDLRAVLFYKGPSAKAIAHHKDKFYLDLFLFVAAIVAILGGAAILFIF